MSASEMTKQAKREYVDKFWEFVLDLEYEVIITIEGDSRRFTGYAGRWEAAYAFTIDRERQIAEINNSIALLNGIISMSSQNDRNILRTTLQREQAALQDIRRGLRKKGE